MSLTHEIAGARPRNLSSGLAAPHRAICLAIVACAAVGFAIVYVGQEQPAYFWDWAGYFDRYKAYGALVSKGGTAWLATLAGTVRQDDYNVAVLTPMLPAFSLFGDGRTAYVATIVALYLMPAAWLAARLAARAQGRARPTVLWSVVAAVLFWPLWIAALRGMPDVAGLVPLGVATLLVIETSFLTGASLLQGGVLGLLVWLSFLLRRWYAYADVALEGWCLVFGIATALREPGPRTPRLRATLGAYAVNLATVVALLLAYQAPLVARILRTSYAELYAGYQKPFGDSASLFLAQSGLLLLLATALGLVRAWRERNAAMLFLGALPATTAFLFLQTQAPSVQHVMPVFFWMFPIALYGAMWGSRDAGRLVTGRSGAVLATLLAGFVAVFVPGAARWSAIATPLLPWDAYPPLRLAEPRAYNDLIADLETRLTEHSAQLAVFASSPHLSGSLLQSLEPRLRDAIVEISDVDARDGLRLAPFAARVVVVTPTPALHLPAAAQRVVAIPSQMIVAGTGPGAAYHRVGGPYTLDGGIEALVYERDRPFDARDAEALTQAMRAVYPTWSRQGAVVRQARARPE